MKPFWFLIKCIGYIGVYAFGLAAILLACIPYLIALLFAIVIEISEEKLEEEC